MKKERELINCVSIKEEAERFWGLDGRRMFASAAVPFSEAVSISAIKLQQQKEEDVFNRARTERTVENHLGTLGLVLNCRR